jgi:hypothetical protein
MLYERDDARVLEAFRGGEFDYVDAIGEVQEADFFRLITERKILDKLAQSYPSPRERHDFPFLVCSGSMIEAFGPAMGHKATHPETGDISLRCEGFNEKNEYDRRTPCDQDFLRKLAGDTDAHSLQTWFNRDVAGIFQQHHAFDAKGIFLGDASYLFVPDNPQYEGSSRLLFDEHNHPVDSEKLTREPQKQYSWRRCYKLVTLLHTNREGEFFLYGGLRLTAGKDHEAPVLYQLVEEFVQCHGRGVMKRLILDRGFLDGEKIGHCKRDLGIDVLLPARRDMDIYQDVVGGRKRAARLPSGAQCSRAGRGDSRAPTGCDSQAGRSSPTHAGQAQSRSSTEIAGNAKGTGSPKSAGNTGNAGNAESSRAELPSSSVPGTCTQ